MNLGIKNIWQSASNNQELEALKNKVDSLANTAAKTNITNTFTANQNINGCINVLLDNMIQLGYSTSDIKLILQSISGTSNAKVRANKGDLILEAATGNKIGVNNNLVVNASAESIILDSTGDKFIAFKNGNTREAYIGRSSSTSRDIEINTGSGNLKLNTSGGKIISNSNYEQLNGNVKILDMSLGYGGTPAIIPDEGTNKPLRFSKGNVRFGSLDFQNQTKLANVPNIKRTTVDNISQNSNKSINLPANSIVLSVYNNSTGKNNPNFVIKDNGQLTITNNNDGVLSSYVVKYWEI